MKDIYKIRSQLEGLCANWATKYITDAQIEELEEVILLSEFHLHKKGSGQIEQMSEMDGKFHKILYEASNSRILEHVLTDFHKYVQLARTMSIEAPERAEKSIEEHREILKQSRQKMRQSRTACKRTYITCDGKSASGRIIKDAANR